MTTDTYDGVELNAGSFRDPAGRVFSWDGEIYRTVNACAVSNYEHCKESGFWDFLREKKWMPEFEELPESQWINIDFPGKGLACPAYVLKHQRIPLVSYSYEWTYAQLRAAALRHLDIQIKALDYDVSLSDGNTFNMQFMGSRPIHIDTLSFKKYEEGEIWLGYDQFCRQFIYPLVFEYYTGVGFQHLVRGQIEGIEAADLAKLLPFRARFSPRVQLHVYQRARIDAKSHRLDELKSVSQRNLSKKQLKNMLLDTRAWIQALAKKSKDNTFWSGYDVDNSYSANEDETKNRFIESFCKSHGVNSVVDLGGNTGKFSRTALSAGASRAVVVDADRDSLHFCFKKAAKSKQLVNTLLMDLRDPSSDRGWAQAERLGLNARVSGDAVFALALIHHLAISGNVPLSMVVSWIMGFAPSGVIEFVPKTDPMLARMLATREDIFSDYSLDTLLESISKNAQVLEVEELPISGRVLISFVRK